MIDYIKQDAATRMGKSVGSLRHELAKIRTGRAHPALLDHLTVPYYGSNVPIKQVANITAEDARTLAVTPWEKGMVQAVEKAIMQSDLGINPSTAGMVIRVPMPPLTEERRRDLIKVARHEAEQVRVAVRNIRRDANHEIKEAAKEKLVSEDEEHRSEESVQKLTDDYIKRIEAVLAEKEEDLLSI